MTIPAPGMDHDLYGFEPLPGRAPLAWPQGARIAACVVLYLEYWELDPPAGALRDARFNDAAGYYHPDYRTFSWREYGNRVGIFRILDLLDRHALPVTVAANAEACRRYPYLVDALAGRGYEFAAHGTHATRMVSEKMSEAVERAFIGEAIDTVAATTGARPAGWIAQDFGESTRTPRLVAEAGLRHVMDFANDDQPYRMNTPTPLLSIPNQTEWDDVQILWHRRVPLARYAGLVGEAFDMLHRDSETSGRYFGLHIHPWLMGAPHRIRELERVLEHVTAAERVWWTTGADLCRHLLDQPSSDATGPGPA